MASTDAVQDPDDASAQSEAAFKCELDARRVASIGNQQAIGNRPRERPISRPSYSSRRFDDLQDEEHGGCTGKEGPQQEKESEETTAANRSHQQNLMKTPAAAFHIFGVRPSYGAGEHTIEECEAVRMHFLSYRMVRRCRSECLSYIDKPTNMYPDMRDEVARLFVSVVAWLCSCETA
jgi:hypothetical protein